MSGQTGHGRQVICILPKLYKYSGNLDRKWFIYYSYRNPATNRMVRFKIYDDINLRKTREGRINYAAVVIETIETKLKNGWSPFEDDEQVIYEDNLKYTHLARKFGRQRTSNKTMNYYLSMFLGEITPNITPSTYTTYKSKFRKLNQWLESKNLDANDATAFTDENARQFIQYLIKKRKLSNNTVRHYLTLFHEFFHWAIDRNYLKVNPFEKIKISRIAHVPAKFFNDSILQQLKARIGESDPQLWLASLFQYYCFIRPGELRFLTLNDMDLHGASITIPGKISKNGKTQTVVIPEPFLKHLEQLRLHEYPSHYYLISKEGKPGVRHVSRNYLYNHFKKVRMELNLPKDYKFYSFKHTGAVKASKFIPVKDLQMQLRHHSLDQVDAYLRQMKAVESESLRNSFPAI
ncbi:MAG: tyrosine-type recombinase/integrase [Bacteroidales bacterium]